jgi:acetyl esterase/lipase
LPPAFIAVGALDLFVEEKVAYAQRLLAAGVPTELHVEPAAFHGFDLMVPGAAVSRRFHKAWNDALRRGLRPMRRDEASAR